MSATQQVDAAFIRRAVELADLNAVRVALYMHTHDPEIAALPKALEMDDAQRELLISKAAAWLEEHATTERPAEPDEAELRTLMNLATKEEMGDLEFEARRELPAFKDFPLMIDWDGEKPEIPDDFMVVIIGTGFSGLAAGVQMQNLGLPYTILERRPEPGGTWSINRYPDIRVDTISITYEFAFEKDYRWSEYFGRGAEVRSYLEGVAKKFGPFQNTRFNADVKKATFDEARDKWVIEYDTPDGVQTIEANYLINGVGTFANPKFPKFEGLDSFEGDVLHPARWPDGYDFTGKRVAVIGNGSTGVQLLEAVSKNAAHVDVYQRTPQWISPRDKYGAPMEPEIVWLLDNFPGFWNWWRYMAIAGLFGTHGFIVPDEEWVKQGGKWNPMNDQLRADLTAYIKAQTGGDEDLISRLVPDYAPFSRRPVVDNNWYKTLTQDHVDLVTDPIARFTPKGIETEDGTVREIDVVITATGFEVMKYLWPAEYFGVDGTNIHEFWAPDGPRAYISMMVPKFPNMFMLYGPNSQPLSGGTGLPIWYVIWSAYAARCITKALSEGKTRVDVKMEAFEKYNKELDAEASTLLLLQEEGAPEENYYINEHGRMQVNAPWYGPEYHRMCTNVEWDDLELS
ncbi:MAG: NAD(P)/FAD-dependent oxidoreductase [Acidimicrobiia bacterium]